MCRSPLTLHSSRLQTFQTAALAPSQSAVTLECDSEKNISQQRDKTNVAIPVISDWRE
jgi:hypothetical protein